ncbi:4-(cytidine 5'-diphospho)-2-C-methyl-D-erythritol kinase [filamentous cyanobacterium CCP5]|nr:4-(cytidine 5'-diphospho)-2-C-methyl-D-erythritol kinase [filamentous cyanobacterium CCP5]
MRLYSLLAAAKINLYLEIIGSRPDGFHELVMVMQSVDLCDRITVRSIGSEEIRLRCDQPDLPTDERNLAQQAAQLMVQKYPEGMARWGGAEITLEKRIPVGAGLAGGSADAAATLSGLNLLWELGLTQGELQVLGAELGSDVPFAIVGGCAIATGRGERLDSLVSLDGLYAVLAKYQNLSVSTPWAYQTYREAFGNTYLNDAARIEARRHQVHAGEMVAAISHHDGPAMAQFLHNDLEKVVLPAYPQVAELKQRMAAAGGLGTLMSGSGPTLFTLTTSQAEAETIATQVRSQITDPNLGLWITRFASTGIRLNPER